MATALRPRRPTIRLDYCSLADVKVPKRICVSTRSRGDVNSTAGKLYRVLEEDEANADHVKVRYIGYSSECDEWRSRKDIVHLNDEESSSSSDESDGADLSQLPRKRIKLFCLYEELASRVKSLLVSCSKADLVYHVNMGFDTIFFDELIRQSATQQRSSQRQVYTIPILSKLDDTLGNRWYVRGINTAGDFCCVTPGTFKALQGQD